MASGSWLLTTGGNWNSNANWSGASFPNATTETATLATDIAADATVTMGQAISVSDLTFSDNGAFGSAWTIAPGGAFSLTLGTSTITTTTNATISAAVNGTAAVTKLGNATLTLSGGAANTGAWAVNAGTLNVTTTAIAASTGAITVGASGVLTSTSAGTIAKPVVISAGSTGNNFYTAGAATHTVSGTATINGNTSGVVTINSGGVATFGGNVGNATINSGGTATFNGNTGTVAVYGTATLNNGTTTAAGSIFGAAGATALLTVAGTRDITRSGSAVSLDFNPTTGKMAVYQTGGTITNTGSGVSFLNFGANGSTASTPYTYYRGTGGTLNSNRYFLWSWPAGDATSGTPLVCDFAGTTVTAGFAIYFGQNDCTVTVTGGSITNNASAVAAFQMGGPVAPAGTARAFTIDGSSAAASVTVGTNSTFYLAGGAGTDALNIVQDGTFSCINAGPFTSNSTKFVNLWGGKLTVTGTFNAASSGGTLSFRLFNRPGYANRLSASTGSGLITQAISEPAGYGVSSLAYTQGAGYIGPPIIKISGGSGTGATARAVWAADGTISSIIVTNPGSGYLAGDTVTFTASNGLPVSGGTAIIPGAVTLTANTAGVGFTKEDSGTLTLTGTNTYTGTTTVSQGTLRIGNVGAAGTLGNTDSGAAAISSGAVLAFNRNDARTYNGTISGAGTINVTGGARATVSGTNTFTSAAAAIALSTAGSILRLTNSDSIGQGTSFGITVASGTALELDGTSGNITGLPSKALTLTDSGVSSTGALRNIAGSNTYSGAIQLSGTPRINSDAGTLTLSSATAIFGAPLTLGGSGDISITSRLNLGASNAVTKDGAGFADLAYSVAEDMTLSALTVSAGTLGYRTTSALSAGTCSVAGNATAANAGGLRFTGSVAKDVSRVITISGTGAGLAARFESSGSAAVTHSTAFTNATTNQTRTYQFGGTGTANNTVSFLIANNGTGAVSLAKADAGKWVLSNTGNSYTGGTTVSGGTLVLSVATWAANAKVTGTGNVSVSAGAKIQTLAGTGASAQLGRHTYASLTFAANSRIRIGG